MVYKLDKINKRILFELDKNCRISDNELAKKVKRSRESVRIRINKLIDDRIILGFITSINPSRFGYSFFKLYFQLANIPKEREKFQLYLSKISGIYWFGSSDGVWDFHATIYAKSVKEFNKLKNMIFTDFKHLIIKRDVGVIVDVRQYPKKHLAESNEDFGFSIFGGDVLEDSLDELDKKIICIIAHNARIPLVELAKKVNSTVDIVRTRIKKMEKKGVIMQYRISVDHSKLGFEIFKAFIYFYNISDAVEQKLINYTQQHKNIVYFIRQLSAWDVEVEIIAESYNEFNEIINDMRLKFVDAIRNYEFALMKEDIWLFAESKIE